MPSASKLNIVITAKDDASKKIKGLSKSMSGLKSVALSLAPVIGVAVLGRAIIGTIKAAGDFEQQLSDISTLISGDATQAIQGFKEGIQELSKITPKDPRELGAAAYSIVSAGITDTAEALKVLTSSTRLAVAGLGTTEEATDLVTSALNSFKIPAEDAERVAAVLFNTVKAGKTTVTALAIGFGQVAPIAAEMGVSLEELSAATAALTTTGLKTSVAQQQLRAALASLLKPTAEAKELFESLGAKSFKQLIIDSGGLVAAFARLKEAAKGDEEMLAKAAGSVEGLGAILSLTGAQADTFASSMEAMLNPVDSLDEAVKKQNDTFNAQSQILKNQVNVQFQNLALKVLPVLIDIMKGLPETIDSFFVKPFKAVVEVLGTLIFKVMQAIEMVKKFKNAATGIASSIGGKIGGAVKSFANVLPFADGGIVTKPTLGLIGESGPEAIIPLDRARGIGGVNVNISGGMFLSQEAAEQMGDLMIDKLKTNLRF